MARRRITSTWRARRRWQEVKEDYAKPKKKRATTKKSKAKTGFPKFSPSNMPPFSDRPAVIEMHGTCNRHPVPADYMKR